MKIKHLKITTLVSITILSLACGRKRQYISPIIPQPAKLIFEEGHSFSLSGNTLIYTNISQVEAIAEWFAGYPFDNVNICSPENESNKNSIKIRISENIGLFYSPDAYRIEIKPSSITIEASAMEGLFYGTRTLLQLYEEYGVELPALLIEDAPRFNVRSLMLDVSRCYIPPAFIKKQLDMMARYKLNRLQLYIGGDGGWRIDIKNYPSLAKKTGWRCEENYRTWRSSGAKFCDKNTDGAYGGFYTSSEIEDLINYAAKHFITVVPMIDLPCCDKNISITAGITCGDRNEQVFVKNLLSDLIRIFPSKYIYIGNGKADGSRSTSCSGCRKRVEKDSKTDNDEPYARTLLAAEVFLKEQGRKLITWEESLRAGVSKETSIIAWHNQEEGLTAAQKEYEVIMAPADFVSLDYYQNDPTSSPESMAGFLPLETVYAFNPVPTGTSEVYAKNICGIQGNMWTQFITDESQLEYMLYPRMLALAEAGWSAPARKSYFDFRKRALKAIEFLRSKGYNCFDIGNELVHRPESIEPLANLAKEKKTHYHTMFDDRYPGSGTTTLNDGERGDWWYGDGRWQGFIGTGISITIDLEKETEVKKVYATFVKDLAGKVYLPTEVRVSISSDGVNFNPLETMSNTVSDDITGYHLIDLGWSGKATTRYIRYEARANKKPGTWLFTDEIVVQ